MALSSMNAPWTAKENKMFEKALAVYSRNTPDRWHKIARAMVGKAAEEVKRRFDLLIEDVRRIEAGQMPHANYRSSTEEVEALKCYLSQRGTTKHHAISM